ncbi:MAG: hypothetical protein ACK5MK_15040, partial [Dysgonomonas sp.]
MRLITTILSFLLFSNIFALCNTTLEQDVSLPDSTITYDASWTKISKESYFYDAATKQKLSSVGFLSQNNTWLQNTDIEFSYDETGRVIREEGSFLDPSTQILVRAYRYDISYNADGNFSSEEYYTKESGQTSWAGVSKYAYTYDSGNIKEVLSYVWNTQTTTWTFGKKYVYNYDQNNNEILFESYNYDQNSQIWKTESKFEKTYSSPDNKLLSEIYFTNSANKISWIGTTKSNNIYDANQQIVERNTYRSENGTDWVNDTKVNYAYSDSKLATANTLVWNNVAKTWSNTIKEEYGYVSGILNSKSTSSWNQKSSSWTPILDKVFTNPDGGFDETTYSYTPLGTKTGISR